MYSIIEKITQKNLNDVTLFDINELIEWDKLKNMNKLVLINTEKLMQFISQTTVDILETKYFIDLDINNSSSISEDLKNIFIILINIPFLITSWTLWIIISFFENMFLNEEIDKMWLEIYKWNSGLSWGDMEKKLEKLFTLQQNGNE